MNKPRTMHDDGYEQVGLGLTFEQLGLGYKYKTVGRTVTEADLVNFVGSTGLTEVLFTDRIFLHRDSDIAGRVVPGALVYSFAEGLLAQATMQHTGLAFLNMELNVLAPTFVGNTIHVACEVIERRVSKGRPGPGLVRTLNHIINQDDEVVITYTPLRMVRMAEGEP